LALLALGVTPVKAVDLAKIDRTIAKEPAYKAKPKYCLLVFGPEGKTRIWLVLDGKTLYLDRTGKGDLTAASNRIEPWKRFSKSVRFRVDNFVPVPGAAKFALYLDADEDGAVELDVRSPSGTNVDRRQASEDEFRFADRAQDAPILYFDGSLSFKLMDARQTLVRGEKPSPFAVRIGTPGLGTKVFLSFWSHDLTATAKIVFPNHDPKDKPIIVETTLQAPG
jgi:hypothetical protein